MRWSRIGITALSCATLVGIGSAPATELPVSQSAAVNDAEVQGQALYDAAKATNTPGNGAVVRTAKALISDFCDFKYRAVVINTAAGPVVYFLALPGKDEEMVFGRHYKVAGSTVTPSTKSCFALPKMAQTAAATVTHLLSDTPTEFHVYLSLVQSKPIYVLTRSGVWKIKEGKVELLQQQQAGGESATPPDRPLTQSEAQLEKLTAAIAPYVARARDSYPQARARFQAGLPPGEIFFVVTRIVSSTGKQEQTFIKVNDIHDGRIMGVIASQMTLVTSYKIGDPYELAESDLLDWVIRKPDGSEEGNVVGKFLDTYNP